MVASAFYTFDPIRGVDVAAAIEAITADESDRTRAAALDLLGDEAVTRVEVHSAALGADAATLLFVMIVDQDDGGSALPPLDKDLGRSRLGRFPNADGDPIRYLMEHSVEDEEIGLHSLLGQLRGRLSDSICATGASGLQLRGWLDEREVGDLLKAIRSPDWRVSSNEPIDGGVGDVCRHLVSHLRAASRRRCGILMRAHD